MGLFWLLAGCGIDGSKDGRPRYDDDRDGFLPPEDCDEGNAAVHPGAAETCDGQDQDCDGEVDDDATDAATFYVDADGDTYGDAPGPRGCEAPAGTSAGAGDCDDADPTVHPGMAEVCNDRDDNCDGTVDSDATDAGAWYPDGDGDGLGAPPSTTACDAPAGHVANDDDCDDGDPAVGAPLTWHPDADGDGWGASWVTDPTCEAPKGHVLDDTDCDDTRSYVHPGGAEVCDRDNVDEDCDHLADDADPTATGQYTWFIDADGDGHGGTATVLSCDLPAGAADVAGDCDESDPDVYPSAPEACDNADQDCDAEIDEGALLPWYLDADGDGYGDAAVVTMACTPPAGYVEDNDDCDDDDPEVYPDETGACTPTVPMRFVVIGDTGTGTTNQYDVGTALADVCSTEGCDFILLVGDNLYPSGTDSTADPIWTDNFELPYAAVTQTFWAVMGNHDWGYGLDPAWLDAQIAYSSVSSKWSMPAQYYSRVVGDVTFYGIDTHVIDYGMGADQEAWLPVTRAGSTTTWNILYGHHPYLSNGSHGDASGDLQVFFETYVCGQYDVYFCGHDHNLQWLEESCGTQFLVSGSGSSTYPLGGTNPAWFEAEALGFLWVEIDGNTFTGVFYDDAGVQLYRRSFTR